MSSFSSISHEIDNLTLLQASTHGSSASAKHQLLVELEPDQESGLGQRSSGRFFIVHERHSILG